MLRRCLLVTLALAAALVVGGPGPAGACTCIARSPAQHLASAEQIFVGEIVDIAPGGGQPEYSPSAVALRFDVEEVFLGEVGPVAEVRSHLGSSGCGLDAADGQRWLIVAHPSDEQLGEVYADFCAASVQLQGAAPRWVGEGRPPDPAVPAPADRSATPRLARLTIGLGAAALAMVGVLAVGRRRRTRPSPA